MLSFFVIGLLGGLAVFAALVIVALAWGPGPQPIPERPIVWRDAWISWRQGRVQFCEPEARMRLPVAIQGDPDAEVHFEGIEGSSLNSLLRWAGGYQCKFYVNRVSILGLGPRALPKRSNVFLRDPRPDPREVYADACVMDAAPPETPKSLDAKWGPRDPPSGG